MTLLIKKVELETFCYESENQKKVEQALRNVASGPIISERITSNLGTTILKLKMEIQDISELQILMIMETSLKKIRLELRKIR